MARRGLIGMGPAINDITQYAHTDVDRSGLSVVAAPAPPQGTYRLKMTGDGTQSSVITYLSDTFTPDNYVAACLAFRLTGTLGSGDTETFAGGGTTGASSWRWRWDYSSSTDKYTISVAYGAAARVTSGELTTGIDYEIRSVWDGTNVELWIDGVSQGTGAETNMPDNRAVSFGALITGMAVGQDHYMSNFGMWDYPNVSDRPASAVKQYRLDPNDDYDSTLFGNQVTCLGGGDATFADWDDYAGGGANDGNTTFVCARGGDGGVELSELSTATVADVGNMMAIVRMQPKAVLGSKTFTSWLQIHDGANSQELQNANIGTTTYTRPQSAVFATNPNSGVWTQPGVNGLKAGVRTVNTNDDSAYFTALGVEVISVGDDPPSVGQPMMRRWGGSIWPTGAQRIGRGW